VLLPKPKGRLQAGLLWTGGLVNYQVELHWPEGDEEIPSPDSVEVRVYPTTFGWFGWTEDKILSEPEVSSDRRTWTYKSGPIEKTKLSHGIMVDAATEMVAVFYDEANTPRGVKPIVPTIRMISPNLGLWKRMDVEIEWGFQAGREQTDFDGRLESYVGMIGSVSPLADDRGTTATGANTWQSRAGNGTRRGIVVPLLHAPDGRPALDAYEAGLGMGVEFSRKLYAHSGRPALDSRITLWTKNSGFTFRVCDLERGPILIPEHGVFVTKAGSGKTARQFAEELAAKNLKSIRQMGREHREAVSWNEVMQEVRLWTCPDGTAVPPFPQVEDPAMQVQLPDAGWNDAWRAVSFQLKGRNMWGGLAYEVGRVAHNMDMVGLHAEADKVYQHFIKSPGVKSDGDFSDGNGALEWATGMVHDIGYNHDGTHASTGRVLFAMAERYFLTGDKDWFQKNRIRMQAAADWIIRQRNHYMMNIPNREDLLVAGLMPPVMLGDYTWPTSDWRWYYSTNTFALQGLSRFADALAEFDPEAGSKYIAEADAFRADFRRVVEWDAALSPVRLGRDGSYHSFIPRMPYSRGMTGPELGAPQYPECDLWVGALPLAEPFAVLDPDDIRMVGTLTVMEELATSAEIVREKAEARKKKGLSADDAWFWHCYSGLPKASHSANIYLLQDDIPNFLRFLMNSYAAMVGANGKLWEHWHLGSFADCDAPDNGTAGWFMENFRNMLVMEQGGTLWVTRGTPRVWLEQGKKIAVKNAPTYFGTLAYEIVSEVDNGKITATVEIPSRKSPKSVIVRFRHPQAKPIKSVMVNGKGWTGFDKDKEVIELVGLTGKVVVTAGY